MILDACTAPSVQVILLIRPVFSQKYETHDLRRRSRSSLESGFVPTMWFSIIIPAIALVCTLSVRDKIVKSEE